MVNKKKQRRKQFPVQRIIILIIILNFILITIALVVSFIFTPENLTKSKLDNLAKDYYENYLYQNIINSDSFKEKNDLKITFEKYETIGLSSVTLRELFLYKDHPDQETIDYIKEYCDDNKTNVTFYPKPPYEKNSYEMEFFYSCNFE